MTNDIYGAEYDQGRFDVLFDLWHFLMGNYAVDTSTDERRDVVDPDNVEEFEKMGLQRGMLREAETAAEERAERIARMFPHIRGHDGKSDVVNAIREEIKQAMMGAAIEKHKVGDDAETD